jgi:hypothetical protein
MMQAAVTGWLRPQTAPGMCRRSRESGREVAGSSPASSMEAVAELPVAATTTAASA